ADSLGNMGETEARLVIVDNTAPFGSIIINNNDAYTDSATVTLTLEYYDSTSGVDKVQYMFNNTTWNGWVDTVATMTGLILQGDGTDTVRYQIRDKAGNMATFTDTIILDRTAPNGTVTINQGAAWTSSRFVTLSLEYTDETGLVSTNIAGARYSNTAVFSGGWEQPNVVKEWQLLPGTGTKVVYYQIKDGAGNVKVATSSINLDEEPPDSISITSPVNGNVYRGTVAITATAHDNVNVGRLFAYKDAVRIGTGTIDGEINYPWLTTTADDGNHTIFVRATDEVGNSIDSELRVITVDNTPPDSVGIIRPTNATVVSGTFTIEAIGADAIGVTRIEFYRDGTSTLLGSSTSSPWVLNVSTSGWTAGSHTLYARCIDRAANSLDSAGVDVIIDTTGPTTGSVLINAGATYSTNGVLNISWTGFSDSLSGIAGYYYGFGTTTSTAYYTEGTNGQLTTGSQGSVTVYVWAKDKAGNHGSFVSDDIFVDTNAPIPYVDAIDGASVGLKVLRGTVDVVFNVTGEGVGGIIGTPQISIDGTSSWTSTSWSLPLMKGTYTWNTLGLNDGVHTLQIRAQDLAGNMGYSTTNSVEVNNIVGAVVLIMEPANNSHVSGTRTIRVIAGDDVAQVDIGVGTGTTATWRHPETAAAGMYSDTTPADGFTAVFNTGSFSTQIGDGVYLIKAIAYGAGGVELGSTTNTGIEVDNTQPAGSITVASLIRGVATVSYNTSQTDIERIVFEYGSSAGTYTIGVDTTSPFNVSWNTSNMIDGTYTVHATAIDEVGLSYATGSTSVV
ncbi:MAG: Ig-like domain-containing protein, partial [bacterium]|nr:Ig-like domain-containing protein [bacterium]